MMNHVLGLEGGLNHRGDITSGVKSNGTNDLDTIFSIKILKH